MARLGPAVLLIQQKIYLRNKWGFILLHSAISRNSLIHWILNLQVPADPQWLSIGRPSCGSEVDHPRPAQSSRDPSLDPSFWCCRFRVGGRRSKCSSLYAWRERCTVKSATVKIEGRSIDSLNIANLRRRINQSLAIQETVCHIDRTTLIGTY